MNFLTFPARPMNGGQFDLAQPKVGVWYAEPKYNGWRTLIHAPSGTMWNRHGTRLTIAHEFAKALALLAASGAEWLDCEALERRHGHGRGTLVVLDLPDSALPYEDRGRLLRGTFRPLMGAVAAECAYSVPCFTDPGELYRELRSENRDCYGGAEFYEGIVCKKAGSFYPRQTLSAARTTATWVKHRWAF